MNYVNSILQGDALSVLRTLPDGVVQCVVTSPPYFNLRNYGDPGQIGLEKTPEEYVTKLVEVFHEVKRVLRKDGVLWLNLGDCFAGSGKGSGGKHKTETGKYTERFLAERVDVPSGTKPKDLLGIPWMVAFALRSDGWYLRSEIIWNKSNCLPESVQDRPTKSHEQVFLLSKSAHYYYDNVSIMEPLKYPNRTYSPATERHKMRELARRGNRTTAGLHDGRTTYTNPAGKNRRSVWTIPTQSYRGAHFAVFPEKLAELPILAGSSPKCCEKCGAPWKRVIERSGYPNPVDNEDDQGRRKALNGAKHAEFKRLYPDKHMGWQPTCKCDAKGTGHCLILDPFAGAGTTLYVALLHSRDFVGIELNPQYIQLIRKRIGRVQPHLWDAIA